MIEHAPAVLLEVGADHGGTVPWPSRVCNRAPDGPRQA
jgi:hypothetical protein